MTFYFDILNTRGRILLLSPASFYLNYVYLVLIQPILSSRLHILDSYHYSNLSSSLLWPATTLHTTISCFLAMQLFSIDQIVDQMGCSSKRICSLFVFYVPPYTIAGGVPAKTIRKRFSDDAVSALLKSKWWDWPEEKIQRSISDIQAGCAGRLRDIC